MTQQQTLQAQYEAQLREAEQQMEYWQEQLDHAGEQWDKWANVVSSLLELIVDPDQKAS